MDDMIFEYNNHNSIYVLNSNYKSYGEFARFNLIESIGVQLGAEHVDKKDLCQHPLTTKPGNRSCPTVSRTLQHKLRNLGNFNDTAAETIANPLTTSSPSPSTSTSSATCLPAAAIQKLFNCSSVVNSGASNCNNFCNSIIAGTNNGIRRCKERDCLSSMETDFKNCNKKKCSNVKSSLIAKKTKFLKFLEEEKWGTSNDGVEQSVPANYDLQNSENIHARSATSLPSEFRGYPCVRKSNAGFPVPTSVTARGPLNNYVKHFAVDATELNAAIGGQQCQPVNWSESGDSNNQQRQQQPLKWQNSNNNSELYKEAAELLGLSCTLCDNCRCLDCQSSYFDCDDSDNYSEPSSMDDYDDEAATISAMELVMHANYYDDVVTTCCSFQQQQNQRQPHWHADTRCGSMKFDKKMPSTQIEEVACSGNTAVFEQRLRPKDNESTCGEKELVVGVIAHTFGQQDENKQSTSKTKTSHKCPAIATANELENCANFSELNIRDGKDKSSNE